MMYFTQTLMISAIAVILVAVLQSAASAMPMNTGTLSLTADHPNIVMARDWGHHGRGYGHWDRGRVGWYGRGRWYGPSYGWYGPSDGWYGPGYYPYRHDDDDLGLFLGGALLGGLLAR